MASLAFIYAVVTIHELGHYYTAKCTGVRVLEVCIGNDPQLFTWKKMLVIMLKKACMYINNIYTLETFRYDELHDAKHEKER